MQPRSMGYWERYAAAPDTVIRPVPENDHVFQQEGCDLALYHFNGLSALRAIVAGLVMFDIRDCEELGAFRRTASIPAATAAQLPRPLRSEARLYDS